jgi:cyclopropane-fatty-acyl-phospholipid synthase
MRKDKAATLDLPNADERVSAGAATAPVSGMDRWLTRKVLESIGSPPLAFVLWNGEEIHVGPRAPVTRVRINDRAAFYQLLPNPGLQFGDLYSLGRIDVDGDLIQALEVAYGGFRQRHNPSWLKKMHGWIQRRPRANTLAGSREHIHHHYDIGNSFYQLWLDHEMQYTCAYFPDPELTLEQAQLAKMEHVCRKLRLRPGDRVVEAGCGWGGLARYMARQYGVRVRAFNISHEQVAYARARAKTEGLSERVEYVEDDYRNISGEYDAFVSVGMLEHVGREQYRELGDVIDRALAPDGRGLIHTIGRNQPELMNEWIEKRIFPGAYPPTLGEMAVIFEPNGFSIQDVENLRLHYAKTLTHWLERFDANVNRVEAMFDHRFVRAWRLYLAGSVAAFTTGSLQLFQVAFTRGRNNNLPWSRVDLYK